MNGQRSDRLIRDSGRSRRALARSIVAAASAVGLHLTGSPGSAAEVCRVTGKKCGRHGHCCTRFCKRERCRCPAGAHICTDMVARPCAPGCFCATSLEGKGYCIPDVGGVCADCTSDAACTTLLGQPAACIQMDYSCYPCAETNRKACWPTTCPTL